MIICLTLHGGCNAHTYVNTDKIRCFYKEQNYTCLGLEENHEIYVTEDPKYIQYIINEYYSLANSGRLIPSYLDRLTNDYYLRKGDEKNIYDL